MFKDYPDDFLQFVIENYKPLNEAVEILAKATQLKWTKNALLQGLEKVAAKPLHPSKVLITYTNNADTIRNYDLEPLGLARLDRAEIEALLINGLVVTKKVMYSNTPVDDIWVDESNSLEECRGCKEFINPTPITLDCVLIDIKSIDQITKEINESKKESKDFSWPISLAPEIKINDMLIKKILQAIEKEKEDPKKLNEYPKSQPSVKSKIRTQFLKNKICNTGQFNRAWEKALEDEIIIYAKEQMK